MGLSCLVFNPWPLTCMSKALPLSHNCSCQFAFHKFDQASNFFFKEPLSFTKNVIEPFMAISSILIPYILHFEINMNVLIFQLMIIMKMQFLTKKLYLFNCSCNPDACNDFFFNFSIVKEKREEAKFELQGCIWELGSSYCCTGQSERDCCSLNTEWALSWC